MIEFSRKESERFKMNVYRGKAPDIDVSEIEKTMKDADLLILRVPTNKIHQFHLLNSLNVKWLVADTLVYYDMNIENYTPRDMLNKQIVYEIARKEDREMVGDLVTQIFDGYKNHYHSNPILNADDILDGYVEWAKGYIEEPSKICFILSVDCEPIGFATTSVNDGTAEFVLFGVIRTAFMTYKVTKTYNDMIRFCQQFYKAKGCTSVFTSTQVHNIGVQNAWMNEGFRLKESFYTLHVMKR